MVGYFILCEITMKLGGYKFFRNTLGEGMSDAFNILMGDHGIRDSMYGYQPSFRFGVLDVLIFPLIARAMINYGFLSKPLSPSQEIVAVDKTKTGFFRPLIGGVGIALEIPRFVAAVGLTLLSALIIIPVHIIKYPFSKTLESRFYQLHGVLRPILPNDGPNIGGKETLSTYVVANNVTLNDLVVEGSPSGTSVSIVDVYYRGMSTIDGANVKRSFFAEATDASEDADALEAGKSLGFNTY